MFSSTNNKRGKKRTTHMTDFNEIVTVAQCVNLHFLKAFRVPDIMLGIYHYCSVKCFKYEHPVIKISQLHGTIHYQFR